MHSAHRPGDLHPGSKIPSQESTDSKWMRLHFGLGAAHLDHWPKSPLLYLCLLCPSRSCRRRANSQDVVLENERKGSRYWLKRRTRQSRGVERRGGKRRGVCFVRRNRDIWSFLQECWTRERERERHGKNERENFHLRNTGYARHTFL